MIVAAPPQNASGYHANNYPMPVDYHTEASNVVHASAAPAMHADNQDFCYEWMTDARGEKVLIRKASQQRSLPVSASIQPPQPSRSVQYRTEYRCSPTSGRTWQVRVPIQVSPKSDPVLLAPPADPVMYEWRIHPHTGVPYQVQVAAMHPQQTSHHLTTPPMQIQPVGRQPAQHQFSQHQPVQRQPVQNQPVQQGLQPKHTVPFSTHQTHYQPQQVSYYPEVHQAVPHHNVVYHQPLLLGQHQSAQSHGQDRHPGTALQDSNRSHVPGQLSVQQQVSQDDSLGLLRRDKVAGIMPISEGGVTRKQTRIIDLARRCPAKWSKQATMSNINLPLFAWGSVSELESSLSGRSEAMSEDVMLGKIRHLQNILEVCCLNSTATDFTGYGWTLARDYAAKVDNEIDLQLVSWQDMHVGVRTATLLSAQMEHPRPYTKDVKKTGLASDKRELCTTYNKCKTEGKCEYEVSHPDKTCQRKHECSYCREKKNQSWKHQVWNCRSKSADS